MDISFSEQDLQFQEEIRAGLNGSEFPEHVREKQEKGTALSKKDFQRILTETETKKSLYEHCYFI